MGEQLLSCLHIFAKGSWTEAEMPHSKRVFLYLWFLKTSCVQQLETPNLAKDLLECACYQTCKKHERDGKHAKGRRRNRNSNAEEAAERQVKTKRYLRRSSKNRFQLQVGPALPVKRPLGRAWESSTCKESHLSDVSVRRQVYCHLRYGNLRKTCEHYSEAQLKRQ